MRTEFCLGFFFGKILLERVGMMGKTLRWMKIQVFLEVRRPVVRVAADFLKFRYAFIFWDKQSEKSACPRRWTLVPEYECLYLNMSACPWMSACPRRWMLVPEYERLSLNMGDCPWRWVSLNMGDCPWSWVLVPEDVWLFLKISTCPWSWVLVLEYGWLSLKMSDFSWRRVLVPEYDCLSMNVGACP
jgi:hypothetical protein